MKTHRFTILSGSEEYILRNAPVGWDGRKRALTRSESAHGIFRTFTSDLTFIKDGFQILFDIWEVEGVNATAQLKVEKFNNKLGYYVLESLAKFDFKTYAPVFGEHGKGIRICLLDNEFTETFEARKDIVIPYDRLETIDGELIEPYPDVIHSVDTPEDPLDFSWIDKDGYRKATIFGIDVADRGISYEGTNSTYYQTGEEDTQHVISLDTDYENPSFRDVTGRITSAGSWFDFPRLLSSMDAFYLPGANSNFVYSLDFTISFRKDTVLTPPEKSFGFHVAKVTFDIDAGTGTDIELLSTYTDTEFFDNKNIVFSGTTTLNSNQGICILMQFQAAGLPLTNGSKAVIELNSSMVLDYSEKYATSYANIIRPHELFERAIEAYTGIPNAFYSEFFGRTDLGYAATGEYANLGFTNGKLIRGFPTGYKIEADTETTTGSKVSQLSYSFKGLLDSFSSIWCLGYSIQLIDGMYKVVVEPRKEFYNQTVLSIAPQVQKQTFSKELNTELFYNSVKIGCNVESYKQLSGLEEYCGMNEYTDVLKPEFSPLEIINPYQVNPYMAEYARRKPFGSYSTTDTQWDNLNFLIELTEYETGKFQQRTTEDFETDGIKGIDLVTTPMNLNLTPARSLYRWGWWLNTGLWKYPTKYVKFSKSSFATGLGTKRTDESFWVYENADIQNGSLGAPLLTGFMVKFKATVTDAMWTLFETSPFGIFEILDETTGEYIWVSIKAVTNQPVKNEPTNWECFEVFPPDAGTIKLLSTADNKIITTNDGYAIEIM